MVIGHRFIGTWFHEFVLVGKIDGDTGVRLKCFRHQKIDSLLSICVTLKSVVIVIILQAQLVYLPIDFSW